jgi:retinol dehydrogenase-12
MLHPVEYGALTQLYAGTSEDGLKFNGEVSSSTFSYVQDQTHQMSFQYLIPWARMGNPNPVALDKRLGEELWKWLEEQVVDI